MVGGDVPVAVALLEDPRRGDLARVRNFRLADELDARFADDDRPVVAEEANAERLS